MAGRWTRVDCRGTVDGLGLRVLEAKDGIVGLGLGPDAPPPVSTACGGGRQTESRCASKETDHRRPTAIEKW